MAMRLVEAALMEIIDAPLKGRAPCPRGPGKFAGGIDRSNVAQQAARALRMLADEIESLVRWFKSAN